jgi:riboflavin-specific deaminase-like protein
MARPFVYVNMAASVDGKITSAAREYPRMTSPYDRSNMDHLRASADAVLVGAQTMRADRPKLYVRTPEMQAHRQSLGKSAGLLKILVTASASIDSDHRFFDDVDGGGLLIATVEDAPDAQVDALAERADVWRIGQRQVDLATLLERLHTERNIERLLVEGGGRLNWAFFEAGLVDELYLTIAPALLGGEDAPTLLEGTGFSMAKRVRLKLIELQREGDELYCRWGVER